MKVKLNLEVMRSNLGVINEFAKRKGVKPSFMIKHQLWSDFMVKLLNGQQVYTNSDVMVWENIYSSERVTIVDAFDRREGVTIEESKQVKDKDIAIVNFCCCNGRVPTEENLMNISEYLKAIGFKTVSFGGSLMLNFNKIYGDEIRVGEALLTGYSAEPYEAYYSGLKNPFEVDIEVYSSSKDGVVVRHGFMEIGGFTDVRTKCVNTDFTVLNIREWDKYKSGSVITLKPDYYTLIKLADKWRMTNVELI